MWQELLDILTKLGKEYQALEGLGKQKHGALVGVDLKTLERLLKREEDIAKSVRALEQQRQALFIRLYKTVPNASREMQAKEIYKLSPPPFPARLQAAHDALGRLTDSVSKQREVNNLLAQGALGAVNVRLGQLGGTTVDPVYGRGGDEHVSHQRNFDFQA